MTPRQFNGSRDGEIDPRAVSGLVGLVLIILVVVGLISASTYVVQPGTRGVADRPCMT